MICLFIWLDILFEFYKLEIEPKTRVRCEVLIVYWILIFNDLLSFHIYI